MKNIPLPCPERLRRVPRQFSWIDHRLVRERHIQGRSPEALALYLMLCTVADARGVSYYSDPAAAKLLGLSCVRLREARGELIAAGLIAYSRPFHQVLSLEPLDASLCVGGPAPDSAPSPRTGQTLCMADILQSHLTQTPK